MREIKRIDSEEIFVKVVDTPVAVMRLATREPKKTLVFFGDWFSNICHLPFTSYTNILVCKSQV